MVASVPVVNKDSKKKLDTPLEDTLVKDIEKAKARVSKCLTLEGDNEKVALAKLERLMVRVGSQVEGRALELLGLESPKGLGERCLEQFEAKMNSALFLNLKLVYEI